MGMAASQARLLSITARIHDVEYQAQSIESAKVQLATQQDEVYREYMDALDEQALIMKVGDAKVPITFNNLCSHTKYDLGGKNYAIKDRYGRLIVEDEVANGYKAFNQAGFADSSMGICAPQAFALFMLDKNSNIKGRPGVENLHEAEEKAYARLTKDENGQANTKLESLRKELENYADPDNIYNVSEEISKLADEDKSAYNEMLSKYTTALTNYLNELYKSTCKSDDGETLTGAQLIYSEAEFVCKEEYTEEAKDSAKDELAKSLDTSLYSYYVNIYNQIEQSGACISISEFNGSLGGDASNDADFLKSKISSGEFTIELVTTNKNGTVEMTGTSPSSDDLISYVNATDVDNTRAKKLEAKYEHDLKEINHKDKQLDMSLSKLETQRKALTTEYDSIKKIIDDNIERTFGIFS